MACGGARVGAGRPRKSAQNAPKPALDQPKDPDTKQRTPLEYMLALMNDPEVDDGRRDRLAVAAAPYVHGKIGEGGKREGAARAASSASGGKFAPSAPPKLVVNNRK